LPSVDDANAFFELKQGLETLFERPVDLLTSNSMRNPYLRQRVEAEQVTLYGA
jgi:predicted nucleotidyltransferase